MAEVQIKSISHRHRAIVDFLLAYPEVKNLDVLCKNMNVSRAWLSVVMQSDVFKEYFEARRKEWEGMLGTEIGVLQLELVKKSLKKLLSIVDDDDTDPRLVLDVADKTATRIFGKTSTIIQQQQVQEISRTVDKATLNDAREILRQSVTTVREINSINPPTGSGNSQLLLESPK